MARDESHREDLMAEATAMVRRAEFSSVDGHPVLVAGFRRDGSLSLYFDQDPVFQFDPDGRLRRAFVDGLLFRTQGSTLARLRRDRSSSDQHVGLLRHDLDGDQLAVFRQSMTDRLVDLLAELGSGRLNQSAVVPDSADVVGELISMLRVIVANQEWLAAAFAGKR